MPLFTVLSRHPMTLDRHFLHCTGVVQAELSGGVAATVLSRLYV